MGLLRSKVREVAQVNGCTLGEPVIVTAAGTPPEVGDSITELWFGWSDSALPSGVLNADGTITPDVVDG